ncbi:MAG: glycosyltransferase family protein [Acidobacteriota bacterium]
MRIAYYISGHGFGHAVRSCVVAEALAAEHELWMLSRVDERFIRRLLRLPYHYRSVDLDVGVIQPASMSIDFERTLEAVRRLERRREATVEQEAAWLRETRVDRVLVDIPPLACVAARRAGIPSAVITNFTWDDIYAPYQEFADGFADAAQRLASEYAEADRLFALPFDTPMRAFASRVSFGLVARRATLGRDDVCNRLKLDGARYALLSYGGIGLGDFAPYAWDTPPGWRLLSVGGVEGDRGISDGVRIVEPAEMAAAGMAYADLVGAVDAVITKPGYGIVSDCIANRTPMIYSDRGPFAEYPRLVEGIRRYLPSVFLEQDRIRAGAIRDALLAIEDAPWPGERIEPLSPGDIRLGLAAFLQ